MTATATEITKQLQEIEKTSAHKSSAVAETARTSRFPEAQNTPHKHETDPHADAHAATEAGPHQLPADLQDLRISELLDWTQTDSQDVEKMLREDIRMTDIGEI